jgi:hypothetical protein
LPATVLRFINLRNCYSSINGAQSALERGDRGNNSPSASSAPPQHRSADQARRFEHESIITYHLNPANSRYDSLSPSALAPGGASTAVRAAPKSTLSSARELQHLQAAVAHAADSTSVIGKHTSTQHVAESSGRARAAPPAGRRAVCGAAEPGRRQRRRGAAVRAVAARPG